MMSGHLFWTFGAVCDRDFYLVMSRMVAIISIYGSIGKLSAVMWKKGKRKT